MYFSVALQQRSSAEWQARVAELPGAVGTGERPELALQNAQANATRILALSLDSEGAHPNRRRFLNSILGAAFHTAFLTSGVDPAALGKTGGFPCQDCREKLSPSRIAG